MKVINKKYSYFEEDKYMNERIVKLTSFQKSGKYVFADENNCDKYKRKKAVI